MSKPLKIILRILGSLALLFLIFTLIGAFASKNHHGAQSAVLNAPPERVWEVLIDIEGLPKRRPEITKVEITGINDQGYKMWREYTDMGGYIDFEIVEQVSQEKLVARMKAASFGLSGEWTYELALENTDKTRLTITEESVTDNIWLRALMVVMGRNMNIKQEFKTLQKVL